MIRFTQKGIYVPQAKVYIDPWKPVDKALITHAHSDHARPGHQYYLSTPETALIMKYRLGQINSASLPYGERLQINGVNFSFHPAGHVVGSAQIRVEYKGEIWVISGDYKLEDDGVSTPFQPVKCHSFVTESTFGLPAFRWKPQAELFADMAQWWKQNAHHETHSVIAAYSLGKAQRIIRHLPGDRPGPVYVHSAIMDIQHIYESVGVDRAELLLLDTKEPGSIPSNSLIIIPPALRSAPMISKLKQMSEASASGWMAMRGARRRSAVDRGFVISDHADWDALNTAVRETGAENIFVTHGFSVPFARWLNTRGYQAKAVETAYGEAIDEDSLSSKIAGS